MRIAAIYGDVFAERVLGNLISFKNFCTGCEPVCAECRKTYGSYVGDIVGVQKVESVSPTMIEDPEEYFKDVVLPECDILLVVAIHHDLLASIDYIVEMTGAKAILAPIEDPSWIPPGLREQVKETLDKMGIENAFPKPFCTLEPGHGKVIDEFIETYHVGRPKHYVDMKDGAIAEIGPIRSAPCGCTWYVSQKVRGKFIDNTEALFEEISKAHHTYPCTASMAKDRELGDAILHLAGFTARYAVCEAVGIEDCRSRVEKESGHRDSRL